MRLYHLAVVVADSAVVAVAVVVIVVVDGQWYPRWDHADSIGL